MSEGVSKACEIAETYRKWWREECETTESLRRDLREANDRIVGYRLEIEMLLREKENK